jgi:hypothetical protein
MTWARKQGPAFEVSSAADPQNPLERYIQPVETVAGLFLLRLKSSRQQHIRSIEAPKREVFFESPLWL